MKRFLCGILMAVFLFSLTACGDASGIIGSWEQEMEISILGLDDQTTAASILRFTFRDDGSGTQEQIIRDGSHPNARRDFIYQLEGDKLILDYGDGQKEEFSIVMDTSSLKLENNGGTFELTGVKYR